jgi:putative DNA primase/helicase
MTEEEILDQCQRFLGAIFEPEDVIEFRPIKPADKKWGTLEDLPGLMTWLVSSNKQRKQIYFGANPRRSIGLSDAAGVLLARCLFADFDGGTTRDEALQRIADAGLPAPTATIGSGGGIHAWWRLTQPIADHAAWTKAMKAMIAAVGSDKGIHDPPRIMRLPGFVNWKYDHEPAAELLEVDANRVYSLDRMTPRPSAPKLPMSQLSKDFITHGRALPTGRRSTMYTVACDLQAHGWALADATATIMKRMSRFDLPADELEDCPRQIANAFKKNRAPAGGALVTVNANAVTVVTDGQPAEALRPVCVNDPQTHNELSLARRLVRDCNGEILYVVDRGVWMQWTGTHWREDREGLHAQRIAKGIASRLWEEIAGADPKLRETAAKFAGKASSRRTIEAAIALAKSEPEIAIEWSAFNQGQYLFNCQNGTLDLADNLLRLRPHQKGDRLTHIAGVKYDANAAAPKWDQFVSEVTCGDEELAAFHQRSFGLALSSDQSEQRLWVHHGNGGNGKGTFLSMIAKVMGSYAGPVSASVFVSNGNDRDRDTKTAQLVGKRLAFAQEADDGSRLSESSVKAMTGSDVCTARYLYQNPFEVNPTWHIHLAVNHRPTIKGRDAGIWRRVLLTPWRASFDGEAKRDRAQIEGELFAEGAGILNWMIRGFECWREDGLRPPAAVQAETSNYRNASDSIAAWMAEECFTAEGAATGSTDLFVSYKEWCYRAGFEALTQTSFGRALEEMGFEKDRPTQGPNRNKVVRKGLGLVPSGSWAGA